MANVIFQVHYQLQYYSERLISRNLSLTIIAIDDYLISGNLSATIIILNVLFKKFKYLVSYDYSW